MTTYEGNLKLGRQVHVETIYCRMLDFYIMKEPFMIQMPCETDYCPYVECELYERYALRR